MIAARDEHGAIPQIQHEHALAARRCCVLAYSPSGCVIFTKCTSCCMAAAIAIPPMNGTLTLLGLGVFIARTLLERTGLIVDYRSPEATRKLMTDEIKAIAELAKNMDLKQ